ncbi:MAG: hypothetical protein H0X01_02175 [Nitrospira sp.]|nr:hypothetical protein [Nitrospira sp.]
MSLHIQGVLACTAIVLTLSTVHCQAVDLTPSKEPNSSVVQGWSEQDRGQWYHTSAGTQLIPYDWFLALEDEPAEK